MFQRGTTIHNILHNVSGVVLDCDSRNVSVSTVTGRDVWLIKNCTVTLSDKDWDLTSNEDWSQQHIIMLEDLAKIGVTGDFGWLGTMDAIDFCELFALSRGAVTSGQLIDLLSNQLGVDCKEYYPAKMLKEALTSRVNALKEKYMRH